MAISTKRNRLHMETLEDRTMFDGGLAAAVFDLPDYPGGDDVFENPDIPAVVAVPAYSSKPDAPVTIYLDFNGHFEPVWGNYENVKTPVFEMFQGKPEEDFTSFNDHELRVINEIWQAVAEDFAPFDINVTTVDPGDFSDHKAVRVAIGGSNQDWLGEPKSGVALQGSFYNDSLVNTVYVFWGSYGNAISPANIASQEVGHAFGLRHQSLFDGAGNVVIEEYNPGDPYDAQPIMGQAGARGIWWQGDAYAIANGEVVRIFQDDMATIASPLNGITYRADDHSNAYKGAESLGTISNTPIESYGVIEQTSDSDWFRFDVAESTNVEINVQVLKIADHISGANLDAKVDLYRLGTSKGGRIKYATPVFIASADQSDYYDRGAKLNIKLGAGTYFAVVRSHGDYGDVGQYTISVKADKTSSSGRKLKTNSLSTISSLTTTVEKSISEPALSQEVVSQPSSSTTSKQTSTVAVESLAETSDDSYEAAVDELFGNDNEVEMLFVPSIRRMV